MMNLPGFLKKRKGGAAPEPLSDKEVGLSGDEQLESHAMDELMDAAKSRDPRLFRQALEALVMCRFQYGESDG